MRYTSSFLVILILLSCSKNKNNKLTNEISSDSLSYYLSFAQKDGYSDEKKFFFTKKAFAVLANKKNDSVLRNNLFKTANQFYILRRDYEVKKVFNLLLEKSIKVKDSENIAKSYNLIGNHYMNFGQNDSAFYYLLKSEKLFSKLKDSLSLGKNYIDKAFVQLYENEYSGCEISSIQALGYLKSYKLRQKEYDAYNLIGISSNELKNFDNSIIYHLKALRIANEYPLISKYHFKANSRNNIGVVYQNEGNHKGAISYFQLGLKEKNLLTDYPSLFAIITDNLAYSKFKINDNRELPFLFFQSLKIREANNMSSGIIANKIHLSEYYASKRDTILSQKYATEALQLAKTTKISGDLLGSLKQLSAVEHKNSAKYSKEYIKISDSLQQEERKAKDRFARIAYETDEIIIEKDRLAEQNRSLFYFFLGSLFVGLLLFVIRSQRAKNRELILKQQQQKVNEDIYNLMISQQTTIEENRVKEKRRIAQELHDGVLGRLFGARLNLDSLNKFSDADSVQSRLNYLSELKNIEQDIREISHDLNREKYVLINNFVSIVGNLLEEQKNSFSAVIISNVDHKIEWDSISNAIKINLYRILQESLQNINKYANAKSIAVDFKNDNDLIILKIIDDGIGFEVNSKKRGIGLQNMLSRTSECDGVFDIKSKKGKGTTITITVPKEIKTAIV